MSLSTEQHCSKKRDQKLRNRILQRQKRKIIKEKNKKKSSHTNEIQNELKKRYTDTRYTHTHTYRQENLYILSFLCNMLPST